MTTVDQLLAGPRGRGLCLELANRFTRDEDRFGSRPTHPFAELYFDTTWAMIGPGAARFGWGEPVERKPPTRAQLAEALEDVPLAPLTDELLFEALVVSVDEARYWQEPYEDDVVATWPELQPGLRRIAEHVVASPLIGWWSEPMAPEQYVVIHDADREPRTASAEATLGGWRWQIAEEEATAERERPADPTENWSGSWWSLPPFELTTTSGPGPLGHPTGVRLVEDWLGWEHATAHRARIPAGARVFELDGADAWAELCRHAPVDVTASKRHDWYRTTGRDGRWVIPDWEQVARRFDAIHLTVDGYLEAATRTIDIDDDTASVLAGWGPGETRWLVDVDVDDDPATHWALNKETDSWEPVAPEPRKGAASAE